MLKEVNGFNGRYTVSENGKVYSMIVRNEGISKTPTKELAATNNKGYLRVSLRRKKWNDPVESKYVHRLVAEAFLPNPLGLKEVNHIDGDKHNNCASNLEWCDRQQNIDHAWLTGLSTKEMMVGKGMTTYIGTNIKTGEEITLVGKKNLENAGFVLSGVTRAISGKRGPVHKGYTWKKIKSPQRGD